jgi:DNA polymerase-3 subunit delta'
MWARIDALGERLPHALLIGGAPGLGKRDFAEALAARLLCENPPPGGIKCDACASCRWLRAGSHPDLYRLVPKSEEESAAAPADEETGENGVEKNKESKSRSNQIIIDQVRAVQEALTVTAHHGGRRVVIVDPAEAMNPHAANALLKLLEEPPSGCVFILVSAAVGKLLPTIRSRCQQWAAPRPDAAQLRRWWAEQETGMEFPAALLALNGGMPLAAVRLAKRGAEALLASFVADLGGVDFDPLRLAGQWENQLKKDKAALATGIDAATLADWMQRWVSDLAALRLGGRVRYFPAEEGKLEELAARMSVAGASSCYNDFVNIRRAASHPLNKRLFLEDMFMRYARGICGG